MKKISLLTLESVSNDIFQISLVTIYSAVILLDKIN